MVSGKNGHQKRDFRAEIMQNDHVKTNFRCTATHVNDFSPKFSIPPRDLTNRSCPSPPIPSPRWLLRYPEYGRPPPHRTWIIGHVQGGTELRSARYGWVGKVITSSRKLYHMPVCPTWGAMRCGCALHFGSILQRKSSNTLTKIQQTPKGAGARRRPPWGAAESSAFVVFCSMYCLTFSVKCCQNAGHTHISLHPLWGTPAYVITFCLM